MAQANTDPVTDPARVRARNAQIHYAPAEARALGTLALLAMVAIASVVLPVGTGILLGTVLAFTTYHFYQPLARRTRKPALVAFGVTAVATTTVTGTLGILGYLLALQGVAVFASLPKSLIPGGPADRIVQRLAEPLRVFQLHPATVAERLSGALGNAATSLAGWATQLAGTLSDALLAVFFMAITMFFVLTNWASLSKRAERLMPLNPRHTRRLMRETRRLGQTVVIGNFGTGVVQGICGGVGYAVAHVPNAALLGAITAVASLVPVFGTMLVWVPAGLILLGIGHAAAGIFVLVWGAVAVVGFCDYVVRPKLVGGGEATSTWMTFVALFGGIKIFGVVGVLLGPILVGVALEGLRLYERARRFRLGLN